MNARPSRQPLYKSLYVQVVTAIVVGVLLGHFNPSTGEAMKPLGDGFIKLIKMIIAPIIFCTVVIGIACMEDMKKVGKTGGLALLYFEIVSSIALVVGLVAINLVGNGVATLVVARWTGDLDRARLARELDHPSAIQSDAPEVEADEYTAHMAVTDPTPR